MAAIVMTLIGDIRYDGRVRKEISTLLSEGHNVELIVSDFSGQRSGGQDLGIPVHYLPMKMWSFAVANFAEQLFFNINAGRLIKSISPDFVHCHDLSALLAGVVATKNKSIRLVFDAHELMPESMGGVKERIWGQIEKYCVPYCDVILMPERHRIEYFRRKHKTKLDIRLLENFPRRSDMPVSKKNYLRESYNIQESQKIVLYTGGLAPGRYVEEIIEAVNCCRDGIVLVLLGRDFKGYAKYLEKKIRSNDLEKRVYLHEPIPHSKMLEYMSSCDIGIALYRNINVNNYYCASNKLYELIALGKSVITNNYPGLLEVVEKNKLGICMADVNPKNLARAFEKAASQHGLNLGGKAFFWEEQQQKLLDIYRSKQIKQNRG
jgi:glycosyltransferase involved in cell wall biosynthesis